MARHNDTGEKGEQIARTYLGNAGWQLLEQNWRSGRAEIDIIAMEGEVLVFVEVKTRRSLRHGPPEESVSGRKMELMARAAAVFMEQINHSWEIRFDVISVLLRPDGTAEVEHLRDAFFPGL